jgi:hypothetical protein
VIGATLCAVEAVLVVAWGYCIVRALKAEEPMGGWFVAYNALMVAVALIGFAASTFLASGQ